MPLPQRIQRQLDQRKTRYKLHSHNPTDNLSDAIESTDLPQGELIRAVLLVCDDERLLAILPANGLLNFESIFQLTNRHWIPASRQQCQACFDDCDTGTVPPIGIAYQLDCLVDDGIKQLSNVCFEPGRHDTLVSMPFKSYHALLDDARYGDITRPLSVLKSQNLKDFTLPRQAERSLPIMQLQPHQDIKSTLHKLDQLPTMPNMAQRLLRLRNDPNATLQDLTEIIQADPSLSAQIIRYARSAFFSYKGKVETIDHAISRVLGFETAMNMALGLAASRTFHNPADGPLGLQAFWRHATYSAALAQSLASHIKKHVPVNPGVAYLSGLLHNFGFLLAGHLFRGEFFLLNKVVAANPHIPVKLIERQILGIEHTDMGASLMQSWNMPEAIIVAIREHHNEHYSGEYSLYAELILLVDQLLRKHGIGEGLECEPSAIILNNLGIDLATAESIALNILDSSDALDSLSRQLAA